MHQDLYSRLYSDGAPAWATLNEGKPHRKGTIWSDSYLISPAVQTAWDNFWNNTPASDSVGLQDHYARAWKHVAERYKGNNTVIGYDVMNEPFVGSEAQMYMPFLFRAFSEVTREEAGRPLSIEEIAQLWSNQDTRYDALRKIADKEKYKQVINSVYKINSKFEKGLLQNFYQKVADSIRSVDTEKIFFFNHSYFCNMGVPTALEPVKLKDGKSDPNVSYAAHGYDLLVDTKYLSNSSYDRLDLIFETIYESGKRMKVPVMIGEWGALGKDAPGRAELAEKHLELFEKYKFSNTYWAYDQKLSRRSYFNALLHPYPSFISGNLISYKYDHVTGEFTCKWKESGGCTMPASIFIPDLNKLDIDNIHVHPEGDGIIVEAFKVGKGGSVIINPMKPAEVREITFTIRNGEEKDIPLIYIN
jgi:endoglycosylceramidase